MRYLPVKRQPKMSSHGLHYSNHWKLKENYYITQRESKHTGRHVFRVGAEDVSFASWDIGRHVMFLQVGTLDVMFFELGHLNWILDQQKLCGCF
jgi:hypothetical protein